jgi:hypothetical protein
MASRVAYETRARPLETVVLGNPHRFLTGREESRDSHLFPGKVVESRDSHLFPGKVVAVPTY